MTTRKKLENLFTVFTAVSTLESLNKRFKTAILTQNETTKLKSLRDIVIALKNNEESVCFDEDTLQQIQNRYYMFMSNSDRVTLQEAIDRLIEYIFKTIELQVDMLNVRLKINCTV